MKFRATQLAHLMPMLLVGILVTHVGLAQQDRGSIVGTILDSSGAAIPNASLIVQNQETGARRELTTDANGLFVAPELPIGVYSVTASYQGFKTKVQEGISVRVSDRVKLEFTLDPGETRETVTVDGEAPLVDAASNTLGGTLTKTDVQTLPLNGRDPNYLLALVPGVNLRGNMFQQSMNGLNTGGQSVGLVTFLMDGVDASRVDAQTITITYGRSQNRIARVNAEGIEEFKIYENSFSAEFGGSAGAAVNIITRSGTNRLHGSLFEFFRNEKLDARNFFNKPPASKPAFRLNQFGGSLGGPIVKDRAFFFASYEGIRQRTGTSLVGLVPDSGIPQHAAVCASAQSSQCFRFLMGQQRPIRESASTTSRGLAFSRKTLSLHASIT